MDSSLKYKRKKRKTRKRLNELKKRLHGNSDKDFSININSACNLSHTETGIKPQNNSITTNRLTLGLFHKAVRSETITRPALSQIRKEVVFNVNNIFDKNKLIDNGNNCILQDSADNHKYSYSSNNSSNKTNYNMLDVSSNSSRSKENLNNNNSTVSDSPAMFSPVQLETTITPAFAEPEFLESLSLTTSSSESSQLGDNHQFYEDFMQSMPKYLMEKTPALLRDDVMEQTKVYLHNLYLEGCRRETEDNILQCIQNNVLQQKSQDILTKENFSPHKNIEEDPINYLRLGYARQQGTLESKRPWKTVQSASSSSANSPLVILNTSNTSRTFIPDTPEYFYFPHKLNQ